MGTGLVLPPNRRPDRCSGGVSGETGAVGIVPDAELLERAGLTRRHAKKLDRFSLLALAAAREALTDSGLSGEQRRNVGIIVSTTVAGWSVTEPQLRGLHREGLHRVSPYLASAWFPAAPQGQVTIQLGLTGFAKTIATDRTGAVEAAAIAGRLIRRGTIGHVLVGGVDAPIAPFVMAAYQSAGGNAEDLYEASAFLLLGPAGTSPVSIGHCATRPRRPGASLRQSLRSVVAPIRRVFAEKPAGDTAIVLDATPPIADECSRIITCLAAELKLDAPPAAVCLPQTVPGDSLGAGSALALHAAVACLLDGEFRHVVVISIDRKTVGCAYLVSCPVQRMHRTGH